MSEFRTVGYSFAGGGNLDIGRGVVKASLTLCAFCLVSFMCKRRLLGAGSLFSQRNITNGVAGKFAFS